MIGFHFRKYDPKQDGKSKFDQLLDIFMQLLTYTNGDVAEALQWMNQLDKEYELTKGEYGMGDFIEDLKDKGYIDENKQTGAITISPKTEQGIRKRSLEEIFGKLKNPDLHRTDDRHLPFHDSLWRRQDHACKKSGDGPERTDHHQISKRHTGYRGIWQ
jgi:hypothetical protein